MRQFGPRVPLTGTKRLGNRRVTGGVAAKRDSSHRSDVLRSEANDARVGGMGRAET